MTFQGSRLFAKILAWFLVTIAAVALVLVAMATHLQRTSEDEYLEVIKESFIDQGTFIVNLLETADPSQQGKLYSLRFLPIVFFDAGGSLVFAPRRSDPFTKRDEPSPDLAVREFIPLITSVLQATDSFLIHPSPEGNILGRCLVSQSGKSYPSFLRLRGRHLIRFSRHIQPIRWQGWGLLIFAVIGLLCLWLARYLVRPIIEFQRVSRSIAGGDFQTRLPPNLTERFDELGALGLDFNRMAERIEATIKGRQQLLWDISHELRTPLARMNLVLELIRQADDSKREQLIQKLERNLGRLNDLIQQILDLSRLDRLQDQPLPRSPIDLTALVQGLLADFLLEGEANRKTIAGKITPEQLFIDGTEELLRRAIENVLRNAFIHTPPGTEITVALSRGMFDGKPCAIVDIRDSGPGVPLDVLPRIFEPFVQGPSAPAKEQGSVAPGFGLGLAIAHRAVTAHGGAVFAYNAEPRGLTVEIKLPLTTGAAEATN